MPSFGTLHRLRQVFTRPHRAKWIFVMDTVLPKDVGETASSLRRFLPPVQKPGRVYPDNSREFAKACQDLQWTHDANTSHRSETNGIAERVVRPVKKGTARAMVQKSFPKQGGTVRWNVLGTCGQCTTKIAHGKTAFENVFGVTLTDR